MFESLPAKKTWVYNVYNYLIGIATIKMIMISSSNK